MLKPVQRNWRMYPIRKRSYKEMVVTTTLEERIGCTLAAMLFQVQYRQYTISAQK